MDHNPYNHHHHQQQLHYDYPPPPPLPPSAELFAPEETTDLFGFLDQFGGGEPLEYVQHNSINFWDYPGPSSAPFDWNIPTPRHQLPTPPTPKSAPADVYAHHQSFHSQPPPPPPPPPMTAPLPHHAQAPPPPPQQQQQPPTPTATPRTASKPLLSTPQKRLNHILSEQKRRNAIRDGYAQLIALLGDPSSAMPSRGRPKGRGKNTKGKSGVLFRAVEYIRWLEEGRDALREEVERRR
ncbi:hypothetical protein BDZ89DRAFT_1083326 [Hymenopellis radicata]|nr:hypothetical protein BDZ89DRAFT_1083326 [Hymenopellis radicata]